MKIGDGVVFSIKGLRVRVTLESYDSHRSANNPKHKI